MEIHKDNGIKQSVNYTTNNDEINEIYVSKDDNFFNDNESIFREKDNDMNSENSNLYTNKQYYDQNKYEYSTPNHNNQNYFQKQISEEELKIKKAHLLWKFNKLNENSRYSSMLLDMESDLEIIENELYRVEKQQQNESGMEVVRNGYLTLISGLELVSKKQKIIALNLDGWSRKVAIDSKNPNYEKVFEEIYEEYFSNIKTNPIIMLTILTIWSGMSVHLSNMALGGINFTKENTYPESITSSKDNNEDDNELDSIIQKMKQSKVSKEFDLESEISVKTNNSNESIKIEVKSDISEMINEKPIKKRGRPKKSN